MYQIDSAGIEAFIKSSLSSTPRLSGGVGSMVFTEQSPFSKEQHAQHLSNFVEIKKLKECIAIPLCESGGCSPESMRYYIKEVSDLVGTENADYRIILCLNNRILNIQTVRGSIDILNEYLQLFQKK